MCLEIEKSVFGILDLLPIPTSHPGSCHPMPDHHQHDHDDVEGDDEVNFGDDDKKDSERWPRFGQN